ncbi:MAG: hypothetical protein HYZ28_09305, partial [Myxococcales bacterium]|nr:hypothetical protein [Myxococcales bacterium]
IRLRCRSHNQYAAELMYGRDFMEEARRRGRATSPAGFSGDNSPRGEFQPRLL